MDWDEFLKSMTQEAPKGGPPISTGKSRADIFSPKTWDEYIGQEKWKKLVRIWVKAAKMQNRTLPNILITGEFGTGKTTLAKLIIQDFTGKNYTPIDASTVGLDSLPRLAEKHVPVIVDEIHNLNNETQDSLNILLDDGVIAIIGCTTDSGALTAPFRSRFRIVHLEPYSLEDLIQIITLDIKRQGGIEVTPAQVVQIAIRSRFNARAATQNLDMIFDLMATMEMIELTDETMLESFELNGIDEHGLRAIDRKYLAALDRKHPTGIAAISQKVGADPHTIIDEIEPYLLRMGFIDRQPRGRVLRVDPDALVAS